ncbi:MAG: SoxR reducing system RseC family protein [Clostridia bacterium]|nr:SoxR reducing system RseC family protein [Clostridia bacterium]
MEQTGFVLETEDGKALVRVKRATACGENCADCNLCGDKKIDRWVINEAGAQKGDTVLLFTKSSSILLMAFTAYIVPIIVAVLACVILTKCNVPQAAVDFISIGVLLLSVLIVAKAGLFRGEKYKSRIAEVLSSEKKDEQD